jgi:hypothetical protein
MRATLRGFKSTLTSSTLDFTLRCEAAPPIAQPPADPPDDGRVAAGDGGCSAGRPGAAGLLIAWLALRPRTRRRPA